MRRAALLVTFTVGFLPLFAVPAAGCSVALYSVDEFLAGRAGTPVGAVEWVRVAAAPRILLTRARAVYQSARSWGEVPTLQPRVAKGTPLGILLGSCGDNTRLRGYYIAHSVSPEGTPSDYLTVEPGDLTRIEQALGPSTDLPVTIGNRLSATVRVWWPAVVQLGLIALGIRWVMRRIATRRAARGERAAAG